MAHEIFGNRFASYRLPAWHKLGTVYQEKVTAVQAYQAMGEYVVEAMPLEIPGLPGVKVPNQALIRRPTADDAETLLLGVVGSEYNLVTPGERCQLWDQHVGKPIETLGILKRGAMMFITTELPTLDIKGDEVRNYLMAIGGMDGSRGEDLVVSPVRTVCMNTLVAAEGAATEHYRLPHDGVVKERLATWMQTIVARAERTSAVLKEAFEIMAVKSPTVKQVEAVLAASYPLKKKPANNAPPAEMESRIARWEYTNERLTNFRVAALGLFEGGMTGYEVPAAKGTFWGLYNAVVETEDYRNGGRNEENTAYENLFGERAERKELAFENCLVLARGEAGGQVKKGKAASK